MPLGVFQVMNGYITRQTLPSKNQIMGVAAWGGVVATGAVFAIGQPFFDFAKDMLGMKKPE